MTERHDTLTVSEWPIEWTWIYIHEGGVVALWPVWTLEQRQGEIEDLLSQWRNLATALVALPVRWIVTNVQHPPWAEKKCADCQKVVAMKVSWLFGRRFMACKNQQIIEIFTDPNDTVTQIELTRAISSCCPLFREKTPAKGKRTPERILRDLFPSHTPQTM